MEWNGTELYGIELNECMNLFEQAIQFNAKYLFVDWLA